MRRWGWAGSRVVPASAAAQDESEKGNGEAFHEGSLVERGHVDSDDLLASATKARAEHVCLGLLPEGQTAYCGKAS